MATSGSTSPIYTILLSMGFLIIKDEMMLSYMLGILFFILSALSFYKLSSYEFVKENFYAIAITAIFICDKWMAFISDSGMETTMFIFVLISCVYFYKERKAVPFAVFLGLILWSRPDGVVFIGALAVDYFVVKQFSKSNKDLKLFTKNDYTKILIIAGSLIVLYFTFNMILSGSLLPNTYNAKLTYYSPEFRSRADFLKFEVWDYFSRGAYGIVMIGFIFSALKLLYELTKKRYNQNLIYIVFILALVFVYWYKLPYAHRFGRYLMPAIPFFLIVSGIGFRDLVKIVGKYFKSRKLSYNIILLVFGFILVFSIKDYYENKTLFAEQCKYISDRQVAAALWIRDNSKESDVIATHDVGAIGYYSNRKIIDVAGLITPEFIDKIHKKNYSVFLIEYLKKNNVKYLLFLREWNRVVNQNPLFSSKISNSTEIFPTELMEVYEFIPDKTLILPAEANSLIMYAQDMISQRAYQQAIQALNRCLSVEPRSSLTYYLIAFAYSMLNDVVNFKKNLLKAVEIFPDYREGLFQLGYLYKKQNRISESKEYFEKYLTLFPDDKVTRDVYNSLPDSISVNNNK